MLFAVVSVALVDAVLVVTSATPRCKKSLNQATERFKKGVIEG